MLRALAVAADAGQLDGEDQRQGAGALAVAMLSETARNAIPDQALSFDAYRQSAQVVDAFLAGVGQS